MFAMGLAGIGMVPVIHNVPHVLRVSTNTEMGGINTDTVIAGVKDQFILLQLPAL